MSIPIPEYSNNGISKQVRIWYIIIYMHNCSNDRMIDVGVYVWNLYKNINILYIVQYIR